MIQPDSFPYFIILFSVAIFAGTYLLFAYYINRLLVLNVAVFFLVAARVASEYYIQQLGTYAEVEAYAAWHILPVNVLIPMQWSMVWLYVRPLREWRWEEPANYVVVLGGVVLPFLVHNYFCTIDPRIFYYAAERIGGYWQFTIDTDFWYYPFYSSHRDLSLLLVVIGALLVGIIRNPVRRLRQSFLLLSYLIAIVIYFSMTQRGEWNIPTTGVLYLAHSLIISWYVSNYRLFRSNIDLITGRLFDSISDLTISTDPNLRVTNYNDQTAAVLSAGRQKESLIKLLDRHSSASTKAISSSIEALVADVSEERTLTLEDNDGNKRILRLRVAPFTNGETLLGYTFLLTDLTEIVEKERQLAELNATKDRFFSIIGHDLRKPVLAFRGVGQKINYLIGKQDERRLAAFVEGLETSATGLSNLLDNLLNWALRERGMLPYRPRLVTGNELRGSVEELFQKTATDKGIDLVFDLPSGTTVFADPNAAQTILRNLVDNALKFTPPGGRITVAAVSSAAAEVTTLSVSDTGVGIPATQTGDLFSLMRTNSRGTDGESGTGLGLHLVHGLVEQNQGRIEVRSRPGVGSTFLVDLPRAAG